ncbi:hypothetical protein ASF65_00625 [Aureimonas sp. Leaf324]|nr:hypothetical protein ASF65_00625 [Aureimonas sp. Leaf324]
MVLVFAFAYGTPTIRAAHAHPIERASHSGCPDTAALRTKSSPPGHNGTTASCCVAHCLPAVPLLSVDDTFDRWPMTVSTSMPDEAGEGRTVAVPLPPPRRSGRI